MYTDMMKNIPDIEFVRGLPSTNILMNNSHLPRLFVLDDLMGEGTKDKDTAQCLATVLTTATTAYVFWYRIYSTMER